MSDWPFQSERRRVWAPSERYQGFLAVAVPDDVAQVTRDNYYYLLGLRVDWMYREAGEPRREVDSVLWGGGDGWLPRKGCGVGMSLVLDSCGVHTTLSHAGLSEVLPGTPVEDPEIIELIQDMPFCEWLQTVKDCINPAEWD